MKKYPTLSLLISGGKTNKKSHKVSNFPASGYCWLSNCNQLSDCWGWLPTSSLLRSVTNHDWFSCTLWVHVSIPYKVYNKWLHLSIFQITETYAFLPREAVTKFLLCCADCQKRTHDERKPSPNSSSCDSIHERLDQPQPVSEASTHLPEVPPTYTAAECDYDELKLTQKPTRTHADYDNNNCLNRDDDQPLEPFNFSTKLPTTPKSSINDSTRKRKRKFTRKIVRPVVESQQMEFDGEYDRPPDSHFGLKYREEARIPVMETVEQVSRIHLWYRSRSSKGKTMNDAIKCCSIFRSTIQYHQPAHSSHHRRRCSVSKVTPPMETAKQSSSSKEVDTFQMPETALISRKYRTCFIILPSLPRITRGRFWFCDQWTWSMCHKVASVTPGSFACRRE